ncbi:MAG: 50S ribosomal protein L25 [Actinobacteria bacterium]|nr:50S ribosomal protein L25 [Actinomycetota bacterium]
MSNVALKVQKRNKEELKKNASRRLRSEGFIPAVVYGLSQEPVEVKIDTKEFKDTIKGRSLANLILDMHIKIDGKDKKETTLIKDMQKDPISAEILHIDFIRIQMKTEVEATVPLHILNEETSVGVKEEGGVLQHGLREIHLICLPADIPEAIEYDIKELHIGDNVRVSDIVLSDAIKILNNPEEVVVSIIHPTHMVVEEEAVAEEEVEEEPELISKARESEDTENEK